MKLKDIEDNDLFTWWTLVDKNGNKITSYENKKNEFSSYVGRKETDKEIYEKYKDCEVLSIYDIDIDINFENNYITVKLNIQEMMIVNNRIEKIIATIMFAVIYGLIIKYTNIDVAIVCVLIQIYVELLLK